MCANMCWPEAFPSSSCTSYRPSRLQGAQRLLLQVLHRAQELVGRQEGVHQARRGPRLRAGQQRDGLHTGHHFRGDVDGGLHGQEGEALAAPGRAWEGPPRGPSRRTSERGHLTDH